MKKTNIFLIFGLVILGSIVITIIQIGGIFDGDIANVDDYMGGDAVPPDPSRAISCSDLAVPAFPPSGIAENETRRSSLEGSRYQEYRKNAYSISLKSPPRDYIEDLVDAGWKVYNDEGFLPGLVDFVSAETDLIAFKGKEWLTLRHFTSLRDDTEYSDLLHGESLINMEEFTWWLDNYKVNGTVVGDAFDGANFVLANKNNRSVVHDLATTCRDHGGVPGYDPDNPESYINPIVNAVAMGCNGTNSSISIFGQRDGTDITSFHLEFGSGCKVSK